MPETAALTICATAAELSPNCLASSWLMRIRSLRIGSIQLKTTLWWSGLAPLFPVVADRKFSDRIHPGEDPSLDVGARPHDPGQLVGNFTHLMRIGAAEAVLNRPADRWAELERENPPDRLGELFLQRTLKAFFDLVPH